VIVVDVINGGGLPHRYTELVSDVIVPPGSTHLCRTLTERRLTWPEAPLIDFVFRERRLFARQTVLINGVTATREVYAIEDYFLDGRIACGAEEPEAAWHFDLRAKIRRNTNLKWMWRQFAVDFPPFDLMIDLSGAPDFIDASWSYLKHRTGFMFARSKQVDETRAVLRTLPSVCGCVIEFDGEHVFFLATS
jgi:hypothetical protein